LEGKAGEQYNIGGDNEWKNIELVENICDILNREVGDAPEGDYKKQITFVTDRPGHDFRYSVDASKIKKELDWSPTQDFDALLTQTVKWYIKKYKISL
jgi:dTDP-glucose 4,6-dehydratase